MKKRIDADARMIFDEETIRIYDGNKKQIGSLPDLEELFLFPSSERPRHKSESGNQKMLLPSQRREMKKKFSGSTKVASNWLYNVPGRERKTFFLKPRVPPLMVSGFLLEMP